MVFCCSFEAFPDAWSGLLCSLDAMDPTLPSASQAGSVARSDLTATLETGANGSIGEKRDPGPCD